MAALPIFDKLHRSVNSPDWEPQFIYYYERSKLDDIRWNFVEELEMLAYKFVPEKMAEFMNKMQDKDIPNLMKLQIHGKEFELRAREKDLFIEKLKGNMDY
ncbi:hypothetical protein Tco_0413669 [Tanacetum coccineum]